MQQFLRQLDHLGQGGVLLIGLDALFEHVQFFFLDNRAFVPFRFGKEPLRSVVLATEGLLVLFCELFYLFLRFVSIFVH